MTGESISLQDANEFDLEAMLTLAENLDSPSDASPAWSTPQRPAILLTPSPVEAVAARVAHCEAPMMNSRERPRSPDEAVSAASGDTPEVVAPSTSAAEAPERRSRKGDQEFLTATCASCEHVIRANPVLSGQSVRCPRCGKRVLVGGEPTADAAAAETDRLEAKLQRAIRQASELPAPPVDETRVLQPTLRSGAVRKLRKRIAAGVGNAERSVLEGAAAAIDELCSARDARAVEAIAPHLKELPLGLQVHALKRLGELGDGAALPEVVAFLLSEEEPLVRGAILALGGLGDSRGVGPLLTTLLRRPEHRFRCIDAVSKIGDAALPPLLDVLKRSSDTQLISAALEMLGRMRNPQAIRGMAKFLSDESVVLRRQSAAMLAQIPDVRAAAALIPRLTDEDDEVRLQAAEAAGRTPHAKFVQPLQARLADPSAPVQLAVIEALGACGDVSSVPRIRTFLRSEDDQFVIAAAEALGRLGNRESVGELMTRLEIIGEDPQRQPTTLRLIDALRRIGDARAVAPLVNLSRHPSQRVRARIAEALGILGDEAARPVLEDLLQRDVMEEVRAAAARALGELGANDATGALIRYGLVDAPTVRVQSVIALGRLKDPAIGPALRELAGDRSPQVRYQAATVLGKEQDAASTPALEVLAFDPEEMVRRAARSALEKRGDTRSEKELRKALRKRGAQLVEPSAKAPARSSRPARRVWSGLRMMDLAPNALAGSISLPRFSFSSLRELDLSMLEALPGGKASLVGVGLLLAVAGLVFAQSLGGPITYLDAPPRGNVAALDASADGKVLVAGRTLGMIEVWDSATKEVKHRVLQAPTRWIACNADGSKALAADARRVVLVDLASSEGAVQELPVSGTVVGFADSADGKFAATLDDSGTLVRWDLQTGKASGKLAALEKSKAPLVIALSSDGAKAAIASRQGSITVWDIGTGEKVAECTSGGVVRSAAFASGDSQLIAACGDGSSATLNLWDLASPASRPTSLSTQLRGVQKVGIGADGRVVAASSDGLELWDLERQTAQPLGDGLIIDALSVLPDGQLAIGDDEEPSILVYARSGKLQHELDDSPI